MNKTVYNKDYFDYYGGSGPYDRDKNDWLFFFKKVAEGIKEKINPKKVLEIGCAKGFLIESLRDIGIEAWGIDMSDYAISQIREDMRPYCSVKSAIEPLEGEHDLIVCMEVVEHLSGEDGYKVIQNICAHTSDVLFSSNPSYLHPDATHQNVRSREYWMRLFAENGFMLDKGFDASFIAPHAMRFRKRIFDVTFVAPGTGISGGVKVILEYCNRLSLLGHNVNLVLLPNKDEKIEWFRLNPQTNIVCSNYDPVSFKKDIPNADIIVATWWETAPLVATCPDEKGRKFYLIQHYESAAFSSPEHTDYTYRLPLNKIVVSSWLKTVIEDISGERCELILSGIDFSQFHPVQDFRKQFPLSDIRIGMVYRPDRFKGLADGMQALEMVKKKYPQLKVILMGIEPPPDFRYDEIYKSPPQQDIKNFYNSLDIFVSPSLLEGFYLPGLEAMACGVVVVATDAGGNRDYAIHGQTALLSLSGIPAMLAENIIKVMENKDLAETLRINGFKMARQFSWDRAIRSILKLFIESESYVRVNDPEMNGLLLEDTIHTKQQLKLKDIELTQLQATVQAQQRELDLIHATLGWKILTTCWGIIDKLFPNHTRRRRVFDSMLKRLKTLLNRG